MDAYHIPVMAKESVQMLAPRSGAVYVDMTLGAGGHSLALLQACRDIRIFGFDRDDEAITEARRNLSGYSESVTLIQAPFSSMRTQLALHKIASVDGVIFDLGVSSHQLDREERGFSFDRDGKLDMRMDGSQDQTAAMIVNNCDAGELTRIFKEFGEEKQAGRLARCILKYRSQKPILRTSELASIIESVAGSGTRESLKTKLRVFQALRIEVNQELFELQQALKDAIMLLNPSARVVVLSYHSLEDRIVKNMFRDAVRGCVCPPRQMICTCGLKPLLKLITGRPVCASEEEIKANPRSRSAKLRAAEKLMGGSQ